MPRHICLLLIIAAAMAGCTGGGPDVPASGPTGNAERGEALYSQAVIRSTQGCVTCHSLEEGRVIAGPSLAGIATRASEIIQAPGYTGAAATVDGFLRESITNPNAAGEAGFSHSIMPDWLTVLDRQEIEDLVAFLSGLK